MRLMGDRLRTIIEAHSHFHNASDCQLTGTHTVEYTVLSFESLIKVLLLVLC